MTEVPSVDRLVGHPVSPTAISTSSKPSFFVAEHTESSCASNMLVYVMPVPGSVTPRVLPVDFASA